VRTALEYCWCTCHLVVPTFICHHVFVLPKEGQVFVEELQVRSVCMHSPFCPWHWLGVLAPCFVQVPDVSPQPIRHLYEQLQHLTFATKSQRTQAVEMIKQISVLMVYADKHADALFECVAGAWMLLSPCSHSVISHICARSYFCEKNMMALFWEILQADCGSEVRVQIIQTVSIMLQNVRQPTWKCASCFLVSGCLHDAHLLMLRLCLQTTCCPITMSTISSLLILTLKMRSSCRSTFPSSRRSLSC